jgi:hypothetical protein
VKITEENNANSDDIQAHIELVNKLDVTDDIKDLIKWKNAVNFYKISGMDLE